MARSRDRTRLSVETLEDRLSPATFAVTSTDDAGAGTLRQAIVRSNNTPGADIITFAIGSGLQSIGLSSALPVITDRVVIAGNTQPGFAGNPLIELAGSITVGVHGLDVRAAGTVIRGLIIDEFDGNGITIRADNVLVARCFIGTKGTNDLGNSGNGIAILNASNVRIGTGTAGGRNVLSGNDKSGVLIQGIAATGNRVAGNLIGTNFVGTADLGNALFGVNIRSGASDNVVGGTTAGARNIISGNDVDGVRIDDFQATGNVILGNYIGTDITGTADLGNTQVGVHFSASGGNRVGGTAVGARNIISGNTTGVWISSIRATRNVVQGNFIGTDVTGTAGLSNMFGIMLENKARFNLIGGDTARARNVISGNSSIGVTISGSIATDNVVAGNYIGTDRTGAAALGNGGNGVLLQNGARENVIGGSAAGTRNVISANFGSGVAFFHATTSGNTVQGNYLGTDKTGTVALGNTGAGVSILAGSGNVIGGAAAGTRNILSGNVEDGVRIFNADSTDNRVLGNYIGTNASGDAALANGGSGVVIDAGASNNVIGGALPAARNVIAGNGAIGVRISGATTTGNLVRGNRIGVGASGAAIGNSSIGVSISSFASNNRIGGAAPGAGNVIANNGGTGVRVTSGTGNAILGNRINNNANLGIDLDTFGVTANDLNDPDAGANDMLNFPELNQARLVAGGLRVRGTINTETNKTLRIEFFASPAADPSGFGEGRKYLGFLTVQTGGGNNVNFVILLPATGVPAGWVVTATATDQLGNTSEFSAGIPVT